ncbi:phosphatase PAP2 family protein [Desulfolucanica intricata]|uniref:phosphatase PAP2 family protein n=1 Tax=Desulfolucanica intricata TaxID=1285191 RepID=UPI00082C3EFC|nr:phosphatase PAP2 family protein [Desulfolucanica intricata]
MILQTFDAALFNFINHELQNPVLDWVMPVMSCVGSGGAIWFCTALMLYFFVPQRGKRIAVLIVLAFLLSNLIANELLKDLFARQRPFLTLPDVRVLIKQPLSYSFPSGHAATSFASAFVIAKKIRPMALPVVFMALAIAFSRIYVGVHYPLDVAAGGMIGWLCALIVLRNEKKLDILFRKRDRNL